MTKTQLVALGVRIAGIMLLIYTLQNGVSFITTFISQDSYKNMVLAIMLMVAIFLTTSLLFIKFPLTIASKLLPKVGDDKLEWNISLVEVYMAAYFLLGLFLLVTTVPQLFYWLVYGYMYKNTEPPTYNEFGPDDIASMVLVTVKLILGVWLLLGARGLWGLVYKLRNAGLKSKSID